MAKHLILLLFYLQSLTSIGFAESLEIGFQGRFRLHLRGKVHSLPIKQLKVTENGNLYISSPFNHIPPLEIQMDGRQQAIELFQELKDHRQWEIDVSRNFYQTRGISYLWASLKDIKIYRKNASGSPVILFDGNSIKKKEVLVYSNKRELLGRLLHYKHSIQNFHVFSIEVTPEQVIQVFLTYNPRLFEFFSDIFSQNILYPLQQREEAFVGNSIQSVIQKCPKIILPPIEILPENQQWLGDIKLYQGTLSKEFPVACLH
ncbi:MAG: hypothetical protein D6797_08200 [Bdellovibrio sp.]|nr:MAG: hypothetical protein D6797_08200 [Bdellovibrio sp.]